MKPSRYHSVEPLYKGQVRGGSFVPYTVEPLYKGQVGDGSFVPCLVEPLYKGQVGDGSFVPYSGASLQGTSWGWVLCPLQWSLSTRDKLGMGPLSLTVEPLYKGQVGDGSFVPCIVEPLYKGQVGGGGAFFSPFFPKMQSLADQQGIKMGWESYQQLLLKLQSDYFGSQTFYQQKESVVFNRAHFPTLLYPK